MAIINEEGVGAGRKAFGLIALVVICLSALVFWILPWWNRPPQMGSDEEVFRTVDALFTALGGKSDKQLAQCEEKLLSYRENGQITEEASTYLNGVIAMAKEGEWTNATKKLYPFMLAQRRDEAGSPTDSHHHAPRSKAKVGK